MIEVPSGPEPTLGDLAGLVDSFRRPTGVPNTSGWLPHDHELPAWVVRELDAVARDFERPAGAFFRFRKTGAGLLVCGGTSDERAAVIDRLAKQLDLRIFTYDLSEVRRLEPGAIVEALAPLYDGRSAIVYLSHLEALGASELADVLEPRSPAALVIAGTPRERELDPAAAKYFRRKLSFAR